MMMRTTIIFILLATIVTGCKMKEKANLIIHHATIYTVDSSFSKAEAIAVKDGKIVAIGANDDILKKYSADETIDAQGKFIYPGLIDAHSHFVGYANSLFAADLYDSKSFEEIVERLQKFAKTHSQEKWIIGRGWDQNKFPGKQFPTNDLLNKAFPDKPVYLTRVDGHAAIANNIALNIAGLKPGQKINGGVIETANGKLTGLLIDNATHLVGSLIPALTKQDYAKRLWHAQQNCFAYGLTTVTDCGLNYKTTQIIDTLQQESAISMRVYAMLSDDKENFDYILPKGPYKTDKLYIRAFKFYADGALGSRGACLLQPYSDKPGWQGFLLSTPAHFDSAAQMLANTDFQMCTHAIGDSGNRMILNIYNKVLKEKNDKRWRVEHAQIINQKDFDLFKQASIVPSVQPTHATSDMYWAEERLGKERLKGGYAFKQLLQENGWLPLGTDFPVEDINPFKTFLAAVFRKDAKGFPDAGFQMENALTKEQTLRGMTIWAAKACFLENEVGSLEKGKKADFFLADKDLMKVTEKGILSINVSSTYLGGKKVFGK